MFLSQPEATTASFWAEIEGLIWEVDLFEEATSSTIRLTEALKHGIYTAEMIEERRRFSELVRESREFLAMLSGEPDI